MNTLKLNSLFFTLIIILFIAWIPLSAQERITVQANEFVGENGELFVFRGYSSSDPDKLEKQKNWNKAYFEQLKGWGANVVRFPIHPRAWRERGEKAYLELLDQGIEWAEENDIYVIIDWHSIGNLKTSLFLHEMYYTDLAETYNFWKIIAERYGDNPTVAFYELFNEPTTNQNKFGRLSWEEWKLIMEDLIVMVRANGGKGVPLVAGFNWAYDLTPVKYQPVAAEGIGYVSHPYPQKREKPWNDKWTADWGYVKNNYPLILTEIGYCGPEDEGAHIPVISDKSYGEAITNYSDQRNISYVVWVFDKEWSPKLFIDKNFTPTHYGDFWKNKLNAY